MQAASSFSKNTVGRCDCVCLQAARDGQVQRVPCSQRMFRQGSQQIDSRASMRIVERIRQEQFKADQVLEFSNGRLLGCKINVSRPPAARQQAAQFQIFDYLR